MCMIKIIQYEKREFGYAAAASLVETPDSGRLRASGIVLLHLSVELDIILPMPFPLPL